MPRKKQIPSYRLHRASGQAVVTIHGRDHYLGLHGSDASREKYCRLIAELSIAIPKPVDASNSAGALTITELILQYWDFVQTYYVKHGRPTSEQRLIKLALRPLRKLYGQTPAQDFGPLALKAIRQTWIEAGIVRLTINRHCGRISRMYKWAAENEIVPASVYHKLQTVSGLRGGRSEAVESDGVKPVPDSIVHATLVYLAPICAAMVRLQHLTGMRSGELVTMRSADIDTSGSTWTYVPAEHKTEHHGHGRPIYLGPKAQQIVKPFLSRDLQAYVFSSRESERARYANCRTHRRPGQKPKPRKTKRRLGERFTVDSYRRAVHRACDLAFPPPDGLCAEEQSKWRSDHRWHPHQLRHSAATRLRKEFGLEAARVILGHRSASVTEVYAEIDSAKAAEIAAKVG